MVTGSGLPGASNDNRMSRPAANWLVYTRPDALGTTKSWHWVVLMTDVHPDELQRYYETRIAYQEAWVRIPGNHRTRDIAWGAMLEMMQTRH